MSDIPAVATAAPSPWWFAKISTMIALLGWTVFEVLTEPAGIAWSWPAQVAIIAGAGLHLWHYLVLKKTVPNLAAADRLCVIGGLYRWVRHPMYLGDLLVVMGLTLVGSGPFSWLLGGAAATAIVGLTWSEDHTLARRFPQVHTGWRQSSWYLLPPLW